MQIMCNVIWLVIRLLFSRVSLVPFIMIRLGSLERDYSLAVRQTWLHNSLGSPRPVNELRIILTIYSSIGKAGKQQTAKLQYSDYVHHTSLSWDQYLKKK